MALNKEEKLGYINLFLKRGKDIDDRKFLLNMKKNYLKVMKLDNLEKLEKEIYKNKNSKDKYLFELKRIYDFLSVFPDKRVDEDLNVLSVKKNLVLKNNKDEEMAYKELLFDILNIELKLRMKIGLVKEFDDYVGYYINNNDSVINFDDDFDNDDINTHVNKK
ncbi:MAG: hypothetical protein VZS44_04145 [Bacilli bacterium]|nr:hypothetical protein [Bacilli bacterium]